MNVAICTPTRDLMFFSAQRPKAALPPDLFTSATRMPRMTRKQRLPARSDTETESPSTTMRLSVCTGLKPAANSAPISTPKNREE